MTSHDQDEPASCEWNANDPEVLQDQITAYDRLRARCPMAHSESLQWSVLRHADVLRCLNESETFSNVVSSYPSVPNGMDPPEHTEYRRIIEPYFAAERMLAFEPVCHELARTLIRELPRNSEIEWMTHVAQPFALRAQSAFLDWPAELLEPLREWMRRNREATRSGNRDRTATVAREFDAHIRALLEFRRQQRAPDAQDVAMRLLAEQVRGRVLTDEEIVSILLKSFASIHRSSPAVGVRSNLYPWVVGIYSPAIE